MCKVVLNNELNGVEMYFEGKPAKEILADIKEVGFRWNGKKICWYAKQSEKTLSKANEYSNTEIHTEVKTVEQNKINSIDLWNLTRVDNIEVKEEGIATKDIAKAVRVELKKRFSFVKFSVTSDYNSIHCEIKSAPFAEDSIYLKAIQEFANKLIESYNYCTCYDPYGDYGSRYHFYFLRTNIYDYVQTELTETLETAIKDFDIKKAEFDKAEELRKEAEWQEYQKQQAIKEQEYMERLAEEKKQEEQVNNNVEVKEIEENDQYFVIDSKFANLNKNNTLAQYQEEVSKGDCYNQTVKITREIHFNDTQSLKYFSNLLLHDFDFIEGTGGSYTDDNRINSMSDYDNMTELERKTVQFNSLGIAVYLNDKIQFVIDAQGYSYARYVGLIDENTTITKEVKYNQLVSNEEIAERQEVAEKVINIANEVITNNNADIEKLYNDNWYSLRQQFTNKIKDNEIKLNKNIIQQIDENNLYIKNVMYRVIKEVDTTKDQFISANIQEREQLTIIRPSMMAGASISHITFKEWKEEEYAQYKDNIKIIFEKKNKLYGTNLTNDKVLIYRGWFDLPKSVLYEATDGGIITKYGSYDDKSLDDIINYYESIGQLPVINTYKPIF